MNKAGVQVFGVVLEQAAKSIGARQLLELKAESSDLVVQSALTQILPIMLALVGGWPASLSRRRARS